MPTDIRQLTQYHLDYIIHLTQLRWGMTFAEGHAEASRYLRQEDTSACFVATEAGQAVGSIVYEVENEEHPELNPTLMLFWVEPEVRKQGLGDQLLQIGLNHARSLRNKECYLSTTDKQSYYHQRGWTHVKTRQSKGKTWTVMQYDLTTKSQFLDLRLASRQFGAEKLQELATTIWPHTGLPWKSMNEYIQGDDPDGPFWAIMVQNEPIGIIGWFQAEYLPKDNLGLRWAGIVPSRRGHGYFREAIEHTVRDAKGMMPTALKVQEIIPVARQAQLIPAFEHVGFKQRNTRYENLTKSPYFEDAVVMEHELTKIDI